MGNMEIMDKINIYTQNNSMEKRGVKICAKIKFTKARINVRFHWMSFGCALKWIRVYCVRVSIINSKLKKEWIWQKIRLLPFHSLIKMDHGNGRNWFRNLFIIAIVFAAVAMNRSSTIKIKWRKKESHYILRFSSNTFT